MSNNNATRPPLFASLRERKPAGAVLVVAVCIAYIALNLRQVQNACFAVDAALDLTRLLTGAALVTGVTIWMIRSGRRTREQLAIARLRPLLAALCFGVPVVGMMLHDAGGFLLSGALEGTAFARYTFTQEAALISAHAFADRLPAFQIRFGTLWPLAFAGYAVLGPATEELFFNAIVVGQLRSLTKPAIVVTTALAFATVHVAVYQNSAQPVYFLSIWVLGAAITYVRLRTASLLCSFCFHIGWNVGIAAGSVVVLSLAS